MEPLSKKAVNKDLELIAMRAVPAISKEILHQAVEGSVKFCNDFPIPGSNSTYGQWIWDYFDPTNPRHSSKNSFRMHWWVYSEGGRNLVDNSSLLDTRLKQRDSLPISILEDVKRFFYLEANFSCVMNYELQSNGGSSCSRNKGVRSIITTTKASLLFLLYVITEEKKKHNYIYNLSDFKSNYISEYAETYPNEFTHFHKTFFERQTTSIVRKNLIHPVTYTKDDLSQISWRALIKTNKNARKKSGHVVIQGKTASNEQYASWAPLHPEFFVWSSETCRALLHNFMDVLGICREDMDPSPITEVLRCNELLPSQSSTHMKNAVEVLKWAFDEAHTRNYKYKSSIKIRAAYNARLNMYKKQFISCEINEEEYKKLRSKNWRDLKCRTSDITPVIHAIYNVRLAAMHLVIQFTGMGYSDCCTLKKPQNGSIISEYNGFKVLNGTKVKGVNKYMPLGQEIWFAPSIVQDAIKVLEFLTFVNGNDYLFGSNIHIGVKEIHRAFNNSSFTMAMNVFLAEHDTEGLYVRSSRVPRKTISGKSSNYRRYNMWEFEYPLDNIPWHPHRLRHSLAAELARLDCDLSYISIQLKHIHTGYKQLNETTFGYGGQAHTTMGKITGSVNPSLAFAIQGEIASAKEEIYRCYFDPERKFAGGAAEKHKHLLKEFFDGKAWGQDQVDRYIKKLAQSGAPLTLCGFGYCNKRMTKGKESETCSGEMCDPDCNSHLITEANAAVIERRFKKCIEFLTNNRHEIHAAQWQSDKQRYGKYLEKLGRNLSAIESEAIFNISKEALGV